MQYDVKTPAEYLELIEDDWRKEKIMSIREIIKSSDSKIEEGIQFKMLCYVGNDATIFHLNAQKNYMSLYVGNIEKIEDSKALLKSFDLGKGCIRMRKSINIHETGLEEFITKTIEIWIKSDDYLKSISVLAIHQQLKSFYELQFLHNPEA